MTVVVWFLKWLVIAAAFYLAAQLIPGVKIKDFSAAMIASAVFAVLSLVLGSLMFFALGLGTLGLAWVFGVVSWWVINAVLLKITDAIMDDMELDGFGPALIASGVISVVSAIGYGAVDMIF